MNGDSAPAVIDSQGMAEARVPAMREKVTRYAYYVLFILVLLYTLNFIDRQILSILAEDIKTDLELDDSQLGFLYGTAFAIFYALFGIPLGRLADTWHRGRLIAMGLATWSLMTVLSGFSNSYAQIAAARVGVGIGEASASPAAFSMLGGYFPASRRALAAAIYSSGVYLGMGLSLPIGGHVSKAWNQAYPPAVAPFGLHGWQVAFMAVGLPGLLLAIWIWTLKDPPRLSGTGDPLPQVQYDAWRRFAVDLASVLPPFTLWSSARHPGGLRRNVSMMAVVGIICSCFAVASGDKAQWIAYGVGVYSLLSWVRNLKYTDPPTHELIWGTRGVCLAVAGFGCLAIVTYAFGFWAAPFAIRTYGISAASVGSTLGIPGAIAAAIGVIVGGRLSDFWKQRDPRGRIFVGMLSAALSVPTMIAMFLAPDFRHYALLSPIVYFCANLWAGSAVATYQDFVLPRMYGTAGATYLIGSTMVGLALGPYASGKVAALTGSLQVGVFSLLVAPAAAILILWQVSRVAHDIERTKLARANAVGEP
jgi:MFS family permease